VEFEEGHGVAAGALLFRLRDAEERARLRESEARLGLAEEEFRRATVLAGKNALSQAELDRARAERQVAEAQRNRREVELKRTEIRAPFAGVLGARLVSPGDRIDPSTDLVRLDAVEQLRLIFSLPEIALALARIGMKLDISVVPYPDDRFTRATAAYWSRRWFPIRSTACGPACSPTSASRSPARTRRWWFPRRRSPTTPPARSSGASAPTTSRNAWR
jgi:membrane fusion protein (multidrug efflux system)